MKNFFSLLIVVIIAGIFSCKPQKKAQAAQRPSEDTITDFSNRKVITDKELYASTTEIIAIDTAFLTKDILHILTKKIQACDAENFKLFWDGKFMKSLPPQTNVKLFLMNDAACKELHPFHLTFNISSVHFKTDSLNPNRTTIIRLGNWRTAMRHDF